MDAAAANAAISTNASERDGASRDLWVGNAIAALRDGPRPMAAGVLRPSSTADLASMLRALRLPAGAGLVALGAGSGVCGGIRPGPDDLMVDLKGLRAIDIDVANGVGRFGAGVLGSHAEAAANALGVTMGHHPSSIATSTVGGWLAARGAGQLSSRYGKIEDIAVGATAVRADGSIVHARRGDPALAEWIGSEGAFVVLTEVELRLWPVREGWTLRGLQAPNLTTALALARDLVRERPTPSVLRVYDPIDSRIALSHGSGGLTRHLRTMLSVPRLVDLAMRSTFRRCLVVVGWEGDGPAQAAAQAAALDLAERHGCLDLGQEPGDLWLHRRHDVSFKAIGVLRDELFADTIEVAAPWTKVEGVYRAVRAAVLPDALAMAHFSHAWSEGCALYFSMSGQVEGYDKVWRRALAAASNAGATISHHHGVGRLKAPALRAELGGAWPVLLQRKHAWDPHGRMNPGVLGLGHVDRVPAPQPGDGARAAVPSMPPTTAAAGADPAADALVVAPLPWPAPPLGTDAPNDPTAGLDAANGLWSGDPDCALGLVEAAAREQGWTLGVEPELTLTVRAWLLQDLVTPAAASLGSARDRLVALRGDLADGARYGTRGAPRHAAGPDLRHALLGMAAFDGVLLRLSRRPTQMVRLEASGDPRALCARVWTDAAPFAVTAASGRVRVWLPWQTAADQALAGPIRAAWLAELPDARADFAAPDLGMRRAAWRGWSEIAPGALLVGCEPAGAWVVETPP